MMNSVKSHGGRKNTTRLALMACAAALLAGCEQMGEGGLGNLFKPKDKTEQSAAETNNGRSVKLVERDVEAPEVFQVTEAGLWDGRPSLGGVWVAHPDVKDPERVIIRSTSNGKFVIGALFRRERETPGPRLQVSSDAAAALGMLAGQPSNLNVTALRREEVSDGPEEVAPEIIETAETVESPSEVTATTLDPVASAAAAIDSAPEPATPAAAPAPVTSSLAKPYVQIGIFSVETNANNTATAMRQAGMVPTVKKQSSKGKTFWRVLVGPATSKSEMTALLKKIKATGFADAYAVTN